MIKIHTEFCNILLFDVADALPPNKSWVSVIIRDYITGEITMRGAYYQGGTFWETDSSHAEGVCYITGKPGYHPYPDGDNPSDKGWEHYEKVVAWMKPSKE